MTLTPEYEANLREATENPWSEFRGDEVRDLLDELDQVRADCHALSGGQVLKAVIAERDALAAEVEELRADVSYATNWAVSLTKERDALAAENERLRQALNAATKRELAEAAHTSRIERENQELRAQLSEAQGEYYDDPDCCDRISGYQPGDLVDITIRGARVTGDRGPFWLYVDTEDGSDMFGGGEFLLSLDNPDLTITPHRDNDALAVTQ